MDENREMNGKEASVLDVIELDSSDDDLQAYITGHKNMDELALAMQELGNSSIFSNDVDKDDIDSEEERDILKGIRDEIDCKVREEMKEELLMYETRLKAIENGELPPATDDDKQEINDQREETDPKLKEAIVKMEKLDRILKKKVKRERQVKRDRLMMEKKLRDEIADMQLGATNFREIKMNTERFLSLVPPTSHNEGVSVEFYEEAEDIPPLFQTQIDESEIKRKGKRTTTVNRDEEDENGERSSRNAFMEETKSRTESCASGDRERVKGKKKNFIKRNKELAGVANEVIAMTDDEKKRLQDLLGDIDELPEWDGSSPDGAESSIFQLALNPGDGFIPDDIEFKSLSDIDQQLKSLMPEDDYLSIAGPGTSTLTTPRELYQSALFTRVGVKSTANLLDGFGEQVLFETKEERDLKTKLESIEAKLEKFKAPNETEPHDHLTDEQLDKLLDQCARSMSRTSVMDTPDSSARSEMSSRQALMINPPKLSEEQLQELLSHAYFPMSSQLSTLKEDTEEENDTNMISAETWKAIVEERLDEDDDNKNEYGQNTSQNALSDSSDHYNSSYVFDDLMTENEEIMNHKMVDKSDDQPPAMRSANQKSVSKEFTGLPKIASRRNSNTSKNSSSLPDNSKQGTSFVPKGSMDSSASFDQLRLPSIDSSSSFLIHAPQGLNNEASMNLRSTPKREPISFVRNDLSEQLSLTSLSDENCDAILQNNSSSRSPQSQFSQHNPKPPPEPH